ncbi:hypothetical protein ACFQ7F_20875 [Streptomyces sp. NPDC056486]|uniref:hypothetical protein n=1 Tax=Streptomyces sp. NPDC056486 TaxID=3345835 RepID=UPI00367BB170
MTRRESAGSRDQAGVSRVAVDLDQGDRDLFLNGRSAVGDIAKRSGLAQSRVSTSVRALVGRSWVATAADPWATGAPANSAGPDAPTRP